MQKILILLMFGVFAIIDRTSGKLIDVEEKSLVVSDSSGVRAVVKDGILYYYEGK